MSTWQMFSDAGNNFRWEISDQEPEPNRAQEQPPSQPHRLPSMADLLLQGTANELLLFTELRDSNLNNTTPTFRTGLGKSAPMKQSSISRALAILGDEGGGDGDIQTGDNFSASLLFVYNFVEVLHYISRYFELLCCRMFGVNGS